MKVKKHSEINISFAGQGELLYSTIFQFIASDYFNVKGVFDMSGNKNTVSEGLTYVDDLNELIKLNADVCFLVEYSKIVDEKYLKKNRFINSHGGLLPQYRGFHGNIWAMINSEKHIGYTIHRVTPSFDAGPIIYQKKVSTQNAKTYHELKNIYMNHWKKNIVEIVKNYVDSGYQEKKQDEKKALYVGKRNIDDCMIDWHQESETIHNMVRALAPPFTDGAFTFYKEKKLFILKSSLVESKKYIETPGKILNNTKTNGIFVKTGDTILNILEISFDGIKYKSQDFFRTVGVRLGIN